MEHYERHCPPKERQYTCLIQPPVGYKINFPGGGTHFHDGADLYIIALARMLNLPGDKLNNGGTIRNVLDVGCGVASFGAYLLPLDIIAMSIAPNDVHENQIQFALERGIPSSLGLAGCKETASFC
ncbi:hypothetical protein MLD38_001626 [Melastoma candidum]|uniref:Uncharacterized protein n=1 Tax=Melastoma candidum TaxID=119954 RepID=A0ACB9SFU5_9MYRT|nr:hypothetical protein MLD38_001626 [Melastoma candidum]